MAVAPPVGPPAVMTPPSATWFVAVPNVGVTTPEATLRPVPTSIAPKELVVAFAIEIAPAAEIEIGSVPLKPELPTLAIGM